jgi:uncharacterized membrane protein YjgN (DUF898 family)
MFFFAIPLYVGYIFILAYIKANITNTVWNQIRIGPIRFYSTLKSFALFKIYLTNLIGIIVSAGLLIPWTVIRAFKYRIANTHVINIGDLSEFKGVESSKVIATGAELTEFFDIDLSL